MCLRKLALDLNRQNPEKQYIKNENMMIKYNSTTPILSHRIYECLDAVVHRVGGHQTHAVFLAGCGEMTHCGPLVLLRVVQEHLVRRTGDRMTVGTVATCRAQGIKS